MEVRILLAVLAGVLAGGGAILFIIETNRMPGFGAHVVIAEIILLGIGVAVATFLVTPNVELSNTTSKKIRKISFALVSVCAVLALSTALMLLGAKVKRDAEAFSTTLEKAEAGDPFAQVALSIMYGKGTGAFRFRNETESARWQRKAAEQGLAMAQFNLARCYAHGRLGLREDKVEALKWFRKSADPLVVRPSRDGGFPTVWYQYQLATMLSNGRDVPEDDVEAVKWFRKAAILGHADSQHQLGLMYENGHGVPKDDVEAAKWFGKAKAQGYDPRQPSGIGPM